MDGVHIWVLSVLVNLDFCFVDTVPLPAPIPVLKSKEPSSPYEVPLEMRSLLKKKKQKLDPVQVFGGECFIHAVHFLAVSKVGLCLSNANFLFSLWSLLRL